METVVLGPNSVAAGTTVPKEICLHIDGEYYLQIEIVTLFNGETYSKAKAVLIEGKYYPVEEIFSIIIDGIQVYGHESLYPNALVIANSGTRIRTLEEAENMGYELSQLDGMLYEIQYNKPYHSGVRNNFAGTKALYKVGFEIEKEDAIMWKKYPAKVVETIGWTKERDGSLGENCGYELISPTYSLTNNRILDDIKKHVMLQDLINAKYTNRCGGHIHVSSTKEDSNKLFKRLAPYVPLLYAMYPQRAELETCARQRYQSLLLADSKYRAVLIKSFAVEFRIFPAVIDVKDLTWRLNFLRYMVANDLPSCHDFPEIMDENSTLSKLLIESGINPEHVYKRLPDEIKYFECA